MEDLVAKAGMTRGALYHQYRDKRDLFRAVFEAVEGELGQQIAHRRSPPKPIRGRSSGPARARLPRLGDDPADPADRADRRAVGARLGGVAADRRQHSLGMVRAVFESNIAAGNIPRSRSSRSRI